VTLALYKKILESSAEVLLSEDEYQEEVEDEEEDFAKDKCDDKDSDYEYGDEEDDEEEEDGDDNNNDNDVVDKMNIQHENEVEIDESGSGDDAILIL